jgi:hypothetical protein
VKTASTSVEFACYLTSSAFASSTIYTSYYASYFDASVFTSSFLDSFLGIDLTLAKG